MMGRSAIEPIASSICHHPNPQPRDFPQLVVWELPAGNVLHILATASTAHIVRGNPFTIAAATVAPDVVLIRLLDSSLPFAQFVGVKHRRVGNGEPEVET